MLESGSYRATAEGLTFDVRVGRDASGRLVRISSDALRDGSFVASLICDAPSEDPHSGIVTGQVSFRGNPELISGDLRLEIDDRGVGSFYLAVNLEGNYRDIFAGRFERLGSFMRRLTIEIDGIEGTNPPSGEGYLGRSGPTTIVKAFDAAGFDTSLRIDSFDVRAPRRHESRGYSLAEIHAAMESVRFADPGEGLNVHVLVCSYLSGRGGRDVLGIMYDFGDADLNRRPREGVAVFYDHPLLSDPRVSEMDRQREYVFTLVHEIGHALNLVHSFDKARPSALSWMQYPNLYPRGYEADEGHDGTREFWRRFSETFDDEEIAHLHHATPREIAAGGFAFGVYEDGASRPFGGVAEPRMTKAGANPLRAIGGVSLQTAALKREYALGEPVFLSIRVKNESGRVLRVPDALDPTDGYLRLTFRSPSGRIFNYRPPVRYCRKAPFLRMPPGGPAQSFDGAPVFLSATGPVFTEPGDYVVSAQLAGVDGSRVVYGRPSVIRIRVPNQDEEKFAEKLWDSPDAMRAIYLRHPLVARDAWNRIKDGPIPTGAGNTTASYLEYVSALGWLEGFAPGFRRQQYDPDPAKATEHFTKVDPRSLPAAVERRKSALLSETSQSAGQRTAFRRAPERMRADIPPSGLFGAIGLGHSATNPFARIVSSLRGSRRFADIVSWNIEHLYDPKKWHRIPRIAELIRNFRCDFWGVQEVDEASLAELVNTINSGGRVRYEYVAAEGNGQQSGAIYRSDTTRVRQLEPDPETARAFEARISVELTDGRSATRKVFYRKPLLLDVRVAQESANIFDFRCAVVHFKSTDTKLADTGSGLRSAAAEALSRWIETDRKTRAEADYLVLGDMNAETAQQGLGSLSEREGLQLLSFGMQERYGSDQALTRIASKRLLDHIVLTAGSVEFMPAEDIEEQLIIRSDTEIAEWTKDFSDHIPVAVRFILQQDAD